MIHLTPKKLQVHAIYLTSPHKIDYGDEGVEHRERRVFLGLFQTDISYEDIWVAIEDSGLWYKVITLDAYDGGKAQFSTIPRFITEGVVFENAKEFVEYLKTGLRYEDIAEGFSMADTITRGNYDSL